MQKIKLTQGKFALVDDEDFEYLNQWKWYYSNNRKSGYAKRASDKMYMHKLINNTPKGFETDHINHNELDNRQKNLRTVTNSQNQFNRIRQVNNTSGFKGVTWHKRLNKWMAQIVINKHNYFLGYFINKDDANKTRLKFEQAMFLRL
jgi:hypothetical protein